MKRDYGLFPIIFAFLLTGYFIAIIFKFPIVGIEVVEKNNEWFVEKIYEHGWATSETIAVGDKVKLINGKKTEEHSTVWMFNRVEMVKTITIQDEQQKETTYPVSYQGLSKQQIIYLFLPVFFILITLALSVLLYQKKNDQSATLLIYFLLALGLFYISAHVSSRGDVVGRIVNKATLPSLVILFMHFLTIYLQRFGLVFLKSKSLKILYLIYIVTVITILLFNFNGVTKLFDLVFVFLLLCFFFIHFMVFYIKNKNSEAKNILKILWVSLFLAFSPAIFFYVIPTILIRKSLVSPELTIIFLTIIPIMLLYLQLKKRLFDIEFILNRLKYYTLVSFSFSSVLVTLINIILDNEFFSSVTFTMYLTIFISTTLFLYLKEFIDYKLRHHLFSEKYNFETSLYTFFEKAKNETKVDILINHLINEIKDVLKVKNVFSLEIVSENEGQNWVVKNREQYSNYIVEGIEAIQWKQLQIGTLHEILDGYGIIIGENHKRKNIIYFGLKNANTNLNIQEKVWVETIAYFSSILLENFQLIEGLVEKIEDYKVKNNRNQYPYWLSRLLFSLSEKERKNLSNDLHDSVLQDLLQMLREIDRLQKEVEDASIQEDLAQLKEKVLDNIHLVRETCNELRPPLLNELGIIQSIQNLIDQTKLRCNFILNSELDYSIQLKDKEKELIIYRVIQELLNNAMKHSLASEVALSLQQIEKDKILLKYCDNGKGIDMTHLNDSFKTMGIFGIKERVKSIGGTISIESEIGKGTKVTIEIQTGSGESD